MDGWKSLRTLVAIVVVLTRIRVDAVLSVRIRWVVCFLWCLVYATVKFVVFLVLRLRDAGRP